MFKTITSVLDPKKNPSNEDLQKISEKGSHFRKEIMSKGGSVSALDAFIAFRGREPDQNALLRAYGLGQSS